MSRDAYLIWSSSRQKEPSNQALQAPSSAIARWSTAKCRLWARTGNMVKQFADNGPCADTGFLVWIIIVTS